MVTAGFEAGAWQAIWEVFSNCNSKRPCVSLDKGCVDPCAAAGPVKDILTAGGNPQLHQTAWTHILDVFRVMEERTPPSLQPYIRDQLMENHVFPLRSWSVYQFVIRRLASLHELKGMWPIPGLLLAGPRTEQRG